MSKPSIRTFVVDDSVFMRTVLKGALGRAASIEVIGSAQNGTEAIEKIRGLDVDVITLDVEMPGKNGLEVLETIMRENPTPVVMVSTRTQAGADTTFRALELGAVDFVAKPAAGAAATLQEFQASVLSAVEAAHAVERGQLLRQRQVKVLPPRAKKSVVEPCVVAIGISAGGPQTLRKVLPLFPEGFPPVVLAQHMLPGFTATFSARLNSVAQLEVREASDGEVLEHGMVLIAPGDRHLRVVRKGTRWVASVEDGPKVCGYRPSVDVLFESVAEACGARAIGLIMTGMGQDGSAGIRLMHAAGATTLAQDKESSVVYGMPKAATATGHVDRVVAMEEIPDVLVRLASTPSIQRRPESLVIS